MPHVLPTPNSHDRQSFANGDGHTECVECIIQTLDAPQTKLWREGDAVAQLKAGEREEGIFVDRMVMRKTLLGAGRAPILSILMVSLHPGTALADAISCPPTVAVKESLAQPAAKDWIAGSDDAARNLAGITFFDGNPTEKRSLVPDKDVRAGKERIALWRFEAGRAPIWLSCRYLSTAITLSKQLPANYKECRLTYGPGGMAKALDCK